MGDVRARARAFVWVGGWERGVGGGRREGRGGEAGPPIRSPAPAGSRGRRGGGAGAAGDGRSDGEVRPAEADGILIDEGTSFVLINKYIFI